MKPSLLGIYFDHLLPMLVLQSSGIILLKFSMNERRAKMLFRKSKEGTGILKILYFFN